MNNYDPTSRRPEPTRLVLLDQVQQLEPGTKIRVLGCVHAYHTSSATLVLKVKYPSSNFKVPTVLASIDNVLDSVNHEVLRVGEWVNVVGYVQKAAKVKIASSSSSSSSRQSRRRIIPLVDVLLIWSAGAVKLDDYQSALRSYQETMGVQS